MNRQQGHLIVHATQMGFIVMLPMQLKPMETSSKHLRSPRLTMRALPAIPLQLTRPSGI